MQNSEHRFDNSSGAFGGIFPAVYVRRVLTIDEVARRGELADVLMRVDKYQLDLHPLGDDALDEYRGGVSDLNVARVGSKLRKACEVRGELYKYAVALYTAHSARYRLSGGKERGVFFPRPKELLLRQEEPSRLRIVALDGGVDEITAAEAVSRVRDSRYRKRIYGDERGDPAADVGKRSEGFKMCDLDADDIARDES